MSDEYKVRKDIDRLLGDVYNLQDNSLRVITFDSISNLRSIATRFDEEKNPLNAGTIDALLEYYGIIDIQESLREIKEEINLLDERIEGLDERVRELEDDNQ